MTSRIYIQDVTLRDGMHAVRHRYSIGQVKRIASALDAGRCGRMPMATANGASFNYGFGRQTDWRMKRQRQF
jgi:4-hydroxy 2-oxovalerate aldolase